MSCLGYIDGAKKLGNPVNVANGGTSLSSATAFAVLCGGTTTTGAFQSIASVGTSGQVLTSNGASALPTFQDAASGGGDRPWTHVDTTAISSDSTLDYTSLSQSLYVFVFRDMLWGDDASSDRRFNIRISDDNGSSWKSGASDYSYTFTGRLTGGSTTGQSTGGTEIQTGGSSGDTDNTSHTSYGIVYMQNANNSSRKPLIFGEFFGGDGEHTIFSGIYNTAAAVNGIRFLPSTGTFVSGNVYQYYITEGAA